ncbi:hypothetical protein NECAME_06349 [Necator americanus]|uniref:Uncharacterized protein n=1 Tax=Necator americanus TaxID=51031 RepID=W2TWT2_NECAM|nr:hypothetical protein NECAME_06349 [Necator americanus]ETN85482.1 hypothetical protein NECAME_06349 [Necator americanus]
MDTIFQIYPVQLKTLLNHETCGSFFKEKVVRVMEGIKVNCVQWDTSPNHIKHRMDIDRDGLLFRECEAEFFGMETYRKMLRRRLWKLTGKATYYACYSDSD